jgi:hypothetical protein
MSQNRCDPGRTKFGWLRFMVLMTACASSGGSLQSVSAQVVAGSQHAKPAAPPALDPYAAAEKTTQGDLGHPFMLPPASRERMHECGVEWQAMKLSGAATDKIWRVFAATCLTAPGTKPPPSSETAKQR